MGNPQPPNGPSQSRPAGPQAKGVGVACKTCHRDITDHCVAGNMPIPVHVNPDGKIEHVRAVVILVPVSCPLCGAPQLRQEEMPKVIVPTIGLAGG